MADATEADGDSGLNTATPLDSTDTATPLDSANTQTAQGKGSSTKSGNKSAGEKSAKSGKGRGNSSLQAAKKKGREAKKKSEEDDPLADYMAKLLITDAPAAAPTGTGLIYDERMTKHDCPFGSDMGKSECPQRIVVCHDRMKELNLLDRCVSIPIRSATEEEILACHGPAYLQFLKDTQTMTLAELKEHLEPDDEAGVSFNNNTYECACLALGGALELTERVVRGELRNGIAVIRPPGHHAQEGCGNGYCYFNNAAIAAQIARTKWNAQRVLIVDWDVHHGQGVQYLFEDDPSVLYFSTHRYDRRKFWPYLTESNWDHIGKGKGRGFNINVPWNHRGHGNAEYLAAFQQILLPIAYEFNPDLVLVASGIDAGLSDPEGEMSVHPGFYAHLTHMLMGLANGKVVVLLEGGYNMKGLAEGISMCTKALLGDPCPPYDDLGKPHDCAVETVLEVIAHHKPYWQCLEYQVPPKSPEQCDEISSTAEASEKSSEQKAETNKLLEEATPEETLLIAKKLDKLISQTSQLKVAPHRCCIAYDERMQKHKPPFEHPERPERIARIFERHKKWGLVDRCLNVEPRMATDEEVALCHDPLYIDETKDYPNFSPRELLSFQDKYSSIYLHQSTHDCARLALGCTLEVVDTVLSGKAQNGVAIVRPPGHHAEYHTAMGFCFFNQVAIAAEYAKKNYGLQRILLVDWDIHHGNGTQHMFVDKKDVLYISLHRYDGGFFFPGGSDGMAENVGIGEGEGYNVNIAWNGRSMGDPEYIAAFQQVVMPIAYEYNPELVLVSAGFDAAAGDPLGGYRITPEGFAQMTHMLCSLAQGKVVLALEGGYNLNSISQSMAYCTRTLLGDPVPSLKPGMPCTSAMESILETLHQHKKYWKCLQYQVALPKRELDDQEVTMSGAADELERRNVPLPPLPDTPDKKPNIMESNITDTPKTGGRTDSNDHLINQLVKDKSGKPSTSAAAAMPTNGDGDAATGASGGEWAGAAGGSEAVAGGGSAGRGITIGELVSSMSLPSEETGLHAVVPLSWCPHLESDVNPLPDAGLDATDPCIDCGDSRENWLCLHCYQVYCGRYVNEHMVLHGANSMHPLVLSYADLSVWCYGCDSYVHHEILLPAKRSAHRSKFGEDISGM